MSLVTDDRLPWFHCYPSKLLGAMAGMKPDQQLVYVTVLLRIYEVRGPCPDTLDALSRRVGFNKRRVSEALDALYRAGKLLSVGPGIMNPFAERVLSNGQAKHEKLAAAGRKGGTTAQKNIKKKQADPPSPASATPKQEDLDLEEEKKEDVGANAPTTPGAGAPSDADAPLDVRTKLFRDGLAALRRITGKGDGACRSLIGKWLKNTDEDCVVVLRAIEDCEHFRPGDPIPWILGALKSRMNPRTNPGAVSRSGFAALVVDSLIPPEDHHAQHARRHAR